MSTPLFPHRRFNPGFLLGGLFLVLLALFGLGAGLIQGDRPALAAGVLLLVMAVPLLMLARDCPETNAQLLALQQANARRDWQLTQRGLQLARQQALSARWRGAGAAAKGGLSAKPS